MKNNSDEDDEMLEEYDFSRAEPVIGKYASRYAEGTNIVKLDPDVAAIFTSADSVNRTLRAVGQLLKEVDQTAPKQRRFSRRNRAATRS